MQTNHFIYWLTCYLIGALPAGLLIARANGIDIRTVGSGNIGATNVFRMVGKKQGLLTFAIDAAKGALPASLLATAMISPEVDITTRSIGGFCSIMGHNWPLYLAFKGGKGVATSAGVILGLAPLLVLIGLAVWILSFLLTRYVSVASILAGLSVGIAVWPLHQAESLLLPLLISLLALLIILRHKTNIQRLRNGTESRFEFNKKKTTS